MTNIGYSIDLRQAPGRQDGSSVFGPVEFRRNDNEDGLEPEIFEADDGRGPAVRLAVRTGFFEASNKNEDPGHTQRCELRDSTKLPLGTAVWHGFSMRVPEDFPAQPVRFVCAQMKAPYDPSGDVSPMFALRIYAGRFFATVEHLFEPGDEPQLAALGAGQTCRAGSARVHDGHRFHATVEQPNLEFQVRMILATDPGGLPASLADAYGSCVEGISVAAGAPLPRLDHAWHDFVVGIAASRQKDELGTIELYVDGERIATARAEFGRAALSAPPQYFKLGIYRDKSPLWGAETTALEYRNIRRGLTRESVELPPPAVA